MSIAGTLRATLQSRHRHRPRHRQHGRLRSQTTGSLVSEPSVVAYRTQRRASRSRSVGRPKSSTAARRDESRSFGRCAAERSPTFAARTRWSRRWSTGRWPPARASRRASSLACRAARPTSSAKRSRKRSAPPGRAPRSFVPQAVAAAVGAGLDITATRRPRMVIDIGGGTTEIAVLIARAASSRCTRSRSAATRSTPRSPRGCGTNCSRSAR